MKQEDAKPLICNAFRHWLKNRPDIKNPTGDDAFEFYFKLDRSGSGLLNFRCSGDKWQKVKIWLRTAGLCEN